MRCIISFQNFISLRRLDAKDIKQSSYENIARISNAVPVTLYLMVPKNVEIVVSIVRNAKNKTNFILIYF